MRRLQVLLLLAFLVLGGAAIGIAQRPFNNHEHTFARTKLPVRFHYNQSGALDNGTLSTVQSVAPYAYPLWLDGWSFFNAINATPFGTSQGQIDDDFCVILWSGLGAGEKAYTRTNPFPAQGVDAATGADITFNIDSHSDGVTWVYNTTPPNPLDRNLARTDFVEILAHEIGHVLGLSHVGNKESIMFQFYENRKKPDGTAYPLRSLSDADRAGRVYLYPVSPLALSGELGHSLYLSRRPERIQVNLSDNVTVPSGLTFQVENSKAQVNLGSYYIRSTGGNLIDQGNNIWLPMDVSVLAGTALKGHYPTIESAFASAQSGETVVVNGGSHSRTSNLVVPAGKILQLNSATLIFNGYYKLRVDGTLLTTGACTFTSSGSQWYGIEFYNGGSGSSLYGSTIQNAQYGVFVYNTSVPISNVTSRYNSTGIYTSVYYTQIHHSLVEENTYGVRCEYYGDPSIVFNNIIRYNGYGVYADASSTPYMGNYPGYNSIFWNDYYDVYSMYGGTIQANGNWWGSYPAQPSIEGYVDYSQELSFDPNGWAKVAVETRSPGSTASQVPDDVWADTTGIADFTAARDLMLSGDEETALQEFQRIANMYPNSIGGMKSLVFIERILEKRGADVKASLESFSSGKASTKVGKTADLLLVSAILKLGDDKLALEKAESLLRCDDVMIEKHALFNAANISWYRLGDRVKAETYFRTLAKEYPDDPLSISGLATLGEKYNIPVEPKKEAANRAPDAFGLDPGYPNPFNPSTQIRYALPEPGHVSLVVYDALGREVSILTKKYQEAGYYTASWNATRESRVPLSSGVYFAQLRVTNDFGMVKYAKTTKLLLIR